MVRKLDYYILINDSDEADAEKECERSLKEALRIDPDNIDAL